jgi:hypothetical protein
MLLQCCAAGGVQNVTAVRTSFVSLMTSGTRSNTEFLKGVIMLFYFAKLGLYT